MKKTTKIILGIILIVFQIIGVYGNVMYEEDFRIPLIPLSLSDVFYMFGYWFIGVSGIILLVSGLKMKSRKPKSKSNTGLFKNIPTSKKSQIVGDRVIARTQELKRILISSKCIDFKKVNIHSLESVLFMYDLECYRQVMTLKYSNFFIETTIRTIFITMEENNRRAGKYVPQNTLCEVFKKLSVDLNNIFIFARKNGVDGFRGVALHLCMVECGMTEEQVKNNSELISKIVNHFNGIINWPIKYI